VNIRHGLAMMLASLMFTGSAVAQSPSPTNRRAPYDAALLCFLANGLAHGMRERAGDTAKAAYYKSKAAESYGVAEILGSALGLSKQQVGRDAAAAQARYLPDMVHDDVYFRQVVANCKALGLM